MLKSMTAYGRFSFSSKLGRFTAEIQSVNRKYLEINVYLPPELLRFEGEVKKWVSDRVGRGQVNVRLTAIFEAETPVVVAPNLPLARQIKKAWDAIANDLGVSGEQSFKLSMLTNQEGILLFNTDIVNEDEYRAGLKAAVDGALAPFIQMKDREGEILAEDIESRLSKLQTWIDVIATKAPGATIKYRQKLVERIEELLPGVVENEDRILREIGMYAEKIDVEEEITRFNSHLKQLRNLLLTSSESIGKTLEFLIQELNREINTIGSKSSDVDVSRLVIDVKSELERIREQIQNVE